MITAKEVASRLAGRVQEVSKYLYPNGKQNNKYWQIGSVNGEAGESLKINLQGDKRGRWADFATDDYGDLLDLWRAQRKISMARANF